MPGKLRRTRSDSTANLKRVMAGANARVSPPAHIPLTDDEQPYWTSIVDEFAKADWTDHQLEIAAFLARTMASLEQQQRCLFTEGPVVQGPEGGLIQNPRNSVVTRLNGQVLAYRRSLGLTARAKAGSTRTAVHRRQTNRAAEKAVQGDEQLFAQPKG